MNVRTPQIAANAAGTSHAWTRYSWVTFALAVACTLVELLAGPGYRLGWWGLGFGLQTIRWSATAAAVVFALAFLGTVLAHFKKMRRSFSIFLAAALLSLVTAVPPFLLWFRGQQLPHIHDVSTDTENPPDYIAVLPFRTGARNSPRYDFGVAAQQRIGYPDIAPIFLELPVSQAFQRAQRIARAMGWTIVAVVPSESRIEATATTLLFGFKDDIVIRVTANGNDSRVDLRSLSRIGGSDFGANAGRIRTFTKKFLADKAD